MNIIETVKSIINSYPNISEFSSGIEVDYTDNKPRRYGLSSIGDTLMKEDMLGNQQRQHNFALYGTNCAYTEYDRLQNNAFLLSLGYYLDKQKGTSITAQVDGEELSGELVSLSTSNSMIFSIPTGDINDGVTYQIQINAVYTIESEEL